MGRKVACSFPVLIACWGLSLFASVSSARAVPPAETLLPDTTKGFVSVPSVATLREKWEATQMGHLVGDPVMKPFVEDLQRQLKSRLDQAGNRIGLVWEDLEGVYGGELAVAAVQPWDAANVAASEQAIKDAVAEAVAKAKEAKVSADEIKAAEAEARATAKQEQDRKRQEVHCLVLLVDVTGHNEQANALVKKVTDGLVKRGAKQGSTQVHGVEMLTLDITVEREGKPTASHTAYYCVHQDMLLATDNKSVAEGILKRMGGDATGSLSKVPAFEAAMAKSKETFRDMAPQVRWYVEPFGMAEVIRGMSGGRKRRGTDLLRVVTNQGFTAIQGVGGYLSLSTGEHEMLYNAYVYAPAVARKSGDKSTDKYDLAMRMLNFPNTQNVQPPAWIPRELATYAAFNWNLQDAFKYAETLVNEYAGDDAVFRDVLKSVETDPNGPMINLEKDLVAHLDQGIVLMADCRIPVTPKSERVLVAVSLKDPEAVRQTINKAMESDPEAQRRDHNGHIIWEMVPEKTPEVETVQIDANFGFEAEDKTAPKSEEEKTFRPNGAITVAKGHLIVSTHVDYIEQIIDAADDAPSLETDGEYKLVEVALDKLGAGNDCARVFSRTDEAYRATYELIRQGKMPEAETLLGKLLNRAFEPEEEGVVREQYIDGSKLPEYDAARRYLGPAGLFSHAEDNGWSITGCLLSKQAP